MISYPSARSLDEIGQYLMSLTDEILIDPIRPWLEDRGILDITLRLSNRSDSICKCNGDDSFEIAFGKKSIRNKFSSERAARSSVGFEILDRGYFNGVLNPVTALSQIGVHEVAHIIWFINNKNRSSNYHDSYFYSVVDRIHKSGKAKIIEELMKEKLSELDLINQETLFTFFPASRINEINNIQLTDDVTFDEKGSCLAGIVKEIKPQTFIVSSGTIIYSVPKYGIRKCVE